MNRADVAHVVTFLVRMLGVGAIWYFTKDLPGGQAGGICFGALLLTFKLELK